MIIRNTQDLYKKIFLFTAIPYGILMGIFLGLHAGLFSGLLGGIGCGLFYGFFMALTIGAMHQFSTKRLKTDYSEDLLGVHQVQVITIKQSFEDAFLTSQSVLEELKKCKITKQVKELGVIHGRVGGNWKSYGENLMLVLSTDGADRCKVTVSSKPTIPTTLVDYGKNAENVRLIVDAFRKRTTVVDSQIGADPMSTPECISLDNSATEAVQDGATIKIREEEKEIL